MNETTGQAKRRRKKTRHDFLLTFFHPESVHSKKWINGFWLVKQWNAARSEWQVAIYSEEKMKAKETYELRYK